MTHCSFDGVDCLPGCESSQGRGCLRYPVGRQWQPQSAQVVIEEREHTHGNYVQQAAFAQALKKMLRDQGERWKRLVPEQRESLDMICVKISRIMVGNPNTVDSWTDIAGYATLISNLLTKGTHL